MRDRGSRVAGWLAVVLVAVLAVGMFAGGVAADRAGLLGLPVTTSPTAAPTGNDADVALIEEAWRAIEDNYVDAKHLDGRELAYGAIRGLTDAVGDDGHTAFLTAEEAKAVDDSLSGTFVGIGVQVSTETEEVIVGSVFPGTPAEEAGLRRGDRIVAVDGTTTEGETLDEVVARVRGPEGESVTLTIRRSGGADFDVTIVRRTFDLPLVSWAMVPGRAVAYVRLEQFATGATKAMKAALEQARADGATALVLDVRANPGGYVNEAIGVTSQFVGDGAAYRTIDRSGAEKEVPVESGGAWTDLPIVVLADGDTASSAEILTGAIQDAGRGRMVGETTFGTGTVLGRFDLSDGSSLRIGVERWLTRGGRPIWHEGLQPDVSVPLADDVAFLRPDDLREMTPAELAASPDAQLLRALEALAAGGSRRLSDRRLSGRAVAAQAARRRLCPGIETAAGVSGGRPVRFGVRGLVSHAPFVKPPRGGSSPTSARPAWPSYRSTRTRRSLPGGDGDTRRSRACAHRPAEPGDEAAGRCRDA